MDPADLGRVTLRAFGRALATLLFLALARPALAQEAAPVLPEDPRAPRFREIERGWFTATELGWMGLFKTPTANPAKYPGAGAGGGFGSGLVVGLQAGVDLGRGASLALVLLGANLEASVSYGAFSLLGAGGDLRFPLLGMRDAQQVDRLHLYAHGRGAWFTTDPKGLFGKTDVLLAAGPGLEYYTRLRHFSVGLGVDGLFALKAKAAGIAVVPTVRYTF
jgi:hypothetical protein